MGYRIDEMHLAGWVKPQGIARITSYRWFRDGIL